MCGGGDGGEGGRGEERRRRTRERTTRATTRARTHRGDFVKVGEHKEPARELRLAVHSEPNVEHAVPLDHDALWERPYEEPRLPQLKNREALVGAVPVVA